MDLKLKRYSYTNEGVFGVLLEDTGESICFTLEHSYGGQPKIPNGTYSCVEGVHLLSNGQSIVTFEVTNVPGHSGILFHPGNTESDSEGCILLGTQVEENSLVQSRIAFQKFMNLESGYSSFQLVVG